eukprot:EG_transcript_10190
MADPSGGDVTVAHRDGLGRCLVAGRDFEAGAVVLEEAPLLRLEDVHGADPSAEALRAFAAAPQDVQEAVLDMYAPDLSHPSDLVQDAVANAQRLSAEPWAAGHPPATLARALCAFSLNSHQCGRRGVALYRWASKVTHACDGNTVYTSQRRPGRLCHVALRSIPAGALITASYEGLGACLRGTPQRRAVLEEQKLFRCTCLRCAGPDWARAVPCRRCSTPPTGPAADAATEPHAVPSDGGDDWRCPQCGTTFAAKDILPTSSKFGAEGAALERRLQALVEALEAGDPAAASALDGGGDPAAPLDSVAAVLGGRHWLTARLAFLHFRRLAKQIAGLETPTGPPAHLRAAWAAQLQRLWHFSEAARHFPGYLHVPNVVQYVDLVVQAGPPGVLPQSLLPLLVFSSVVELVVHDNGSVLARVMAHFKAADPPAAVLREAGNAAFRTGRGAAAVLFYRAAILLEPRTAALYSNLCAAYELAGDEDEAIAAGHHCVALAPDWPKGHYHLAAALTA